MNYTELIPHSFKDTKQQLLFEEEDKIIEEGLEKQREKRYSDKTKK